MKTRVLFALVMLGAWTLGTNVSAHHSFAAEFNADAPVDLTGYVTKVEWLNPHTFIYIDVEDEDGNFRNWAVELGSPNGLMRRGWTRNSLSIGDEINVVGSQARDGSDKANARSVTLSNGERMFAGSSQRDAEED